MMFSNSFLPVCLVMSVFGLTACNQQETQKAEIKSISEAPAVQAEPAQPASTPEMSATEKPAADSSLAFTAYGNQGANWRIVTHGDTMEVYIADMAEETIPVVMAATDKGVNFSGKLKDKDVLVQITKEPCTDDNKQTVEFMATVDYGDKHFMGCAIAGAVEVAPT